MNWVSKGTLLCMCFTVGHGVRKGLSFDAGARPPRSWRPHWKLHLRLPSGLVSERNVVDDDGAFSSPSFYDRGRIDALAFRIGRRPAFFIYLFIECAFGIATAFANDFVTWTAFRIGVGFTVPAIMGTPYVLGE